MPVPITGLYAALLAVVMLTLMVRVARMRVRTGVSILHGDDMNLAQAMRQHGNFIEAVPLALILMAVVEANGANSILLHANGIVLLVARIAHPFGLTIKGVEHPLRAVGVVGTLLMTLVLAGVALWQAVMTIQAPAP